MLPTVQCTHEMHTRAESVPCLEPAETAVPRIASKPPGHTHAPAVFASAARHLLAERRCPPLGRPWRRRRRRCRRRPPPRHRCSGGAPADAAPGSQGPSHTRAPAAALVVLHNTVSYQSADVICCASMIPQTPPRRPSEVCVPCTDGGAQGQAEETTISELSGAHPRGAAGLGAAPSAEGSAPSLAPGDRPPAAVARHRCRCRRCRCRCCRCRCCHCRCCCRYFRYFRRRHSVTRRDMRECTAVRERSSCISSHHF
jgi:hypothetical protein